MRRHNQVGQLAPLRMRRLQDRRDAHPFSSERRTQFRQHTCPIGNLQAQIRTDVDVGQRSKSRRLIDVSQVPGRLTRRQTTRDFEDVRHDRTRCRAGPGARALEDNGTDRFARHRDCIQDAFNPRHRVISRDQSRMNAEVKSR